jgi:hypothetical protein
MSCAKEAAIFPWFMTIHSPRSLSRIIVNWIAEHYVQLSAKQA